MKRLLDNKKAVIILGGIAILALVVLAAGLHAVDFKPAVSFQISSSAQPFTLEAVAKSIQETPYWKKFIFWVIAGVLILAIFTVLTPEQRKRLFWSLVRLALVLWMISFVLKNYHISRQAETEAEEILAPAAAAQNVPLPEFVPPRITPNTATLITFAIIVVLLALVWWLISRLPRRRKAVPLEEIAAIARSTLDDLSSGKDWENAIVQCYVRMNKVIGDRRGIKRTAAMTPTEFALNLEQAGLPGSEVKRLTNLFERVRYGAKHSSQKDIDEAVSCLRTILQACQEAL